MMMSRWGCSIMTFKDKLILYLHNKSITIDNDLQENVNFFRYRRLDEVDYLELIIKKARKDLFDEVLSDIMNIMKITK